MYFYISTSAISGQCPIWLFYERIIIIIIIIIIIVVVVVVVVNHRLTWYRHTPKASHLYGRGFIVLHLGIRTSSLHTKQNRDPTR
jgi:threonine/homoserine/homoserine lactone efflux protein